MFVDIVTAVWVHEMIQNSPIMLGGRLLVIDFGKPLAPRGRRPYTADYLIHTPQGSRVANMHGVTSSAPMNVYVGDTGGDGGNGHYHHDNAPYVMQYPVQYIPSPHFYR